MLPRQYTHSCIYQSRVFFLILFLIGTGAFLRGFFFTRLFSSTVIVQIAYLGFEVAEMSSTNIYFIKTRLYKMLDADFGSYM